MKFAIAYYFLLIYSTAILKPLIPVAEDAVMHCFAEAYHISTVHAKYGNDHLEKEVAAGTDDNDKSNKPAVKDDETITAHIAVAAPQYIFTNTIPEVLCYIELKSALHKIVLNKLVPPPRIFN